MHTCMRACMHACMHYVTTCNHAESKLVLRPPRLGDALNALVNGTVVSTVVSQMMVVQSLWRKCAWEWYSGSCTSRMKVGIFTFWCVDQTVKKMFKNAKALHKSDCVLPLFSEGFCGVFSKGQPDNPPKRKGFPPKAKVSLATESRFGNSQPAEWSPPIGLLCCNVSMFWFTWFNSPIGGIELII